MTEGAENSHPCAQLSNSKKRTAVLGLSENAKLKLNSISLVLSMVSVESLVLVEVF